jgi:hypothetical protein
MQVTIKGFDVAPMEVRNTGIELEVRSPDGTQQLGDLILTKTRLDSEPILVLRPCKLGRYFHQADHVICIGSFGPAADSLLDG